MNDAPKSNTDPTNIWAKLGYIAGDHNFSISAGQTEDIAGSGDEASSVAVAWLTKPIPSVEVYASARVQTSEVVGAEDVTALIVGGRLKF